MERSPFYSPVRVATFVVVLAIALTLALIPIDPERRLPTLGQAPEEPVLAAEDLRVESAALSEEAAEAAAAAVAPRFTLDTGVRTAQVAVLANLLEAVDEVRDAPDLSDRERSSMLADLPDLRASARAQRDILDFSARRWQQVADRSVTLLAEVLTDNVEEDEVPAVREGLRERVGDELRQSQQVDVVVELVAPLVEANVTEDGAATAAAREEARTAAEPVIREIVRGTVVVGAGEVVDELAAEVLALLPEQGRGVPIDELAALLILALSSAGILGAYLLIARPDSAASNRRLVLLAVLVIGSVAAARWFLPVVLPDEREKFLDLVLPLAIAAVLIAALLDRTLALLSATVVAILAGTAAVVHPNFGVGEAPEAPQALRPLVVFLLSGVAGAYTTQRIERLTRYGVAGVVVGATVFLVGLAFWLLDTGRATEDVGWLVLVAVVVAVSTGVLAIGASSFLGLAFGVTTRWQLLELAQLTRPVLRRLQEEAPGTFHHSLLVATMAERAAAQVGADALLVRVGAYYHDIGKLAKPHMYIENQAEGGNPHDGLDPLESARVIQDHVRWGLELGRRERLPSQIRAFIPEHHGTRLVTYFYRKAALTNPDVEPSLFTYAGPRPQSRETAIVMLADSCEAVVRSSKLRDEETIDRLVDAVIDERLNERQFEECDLTLRQLRAVAESFKVTLRGVYHPRIEYPAPTEAEQRRRPGAPLPTGVSAAPEPVGEAPVDGSALPRISSSAKEDAGDP